MYGCPVTTIHRLYICILVHVCFNMTFHIWKLGRSPKLVVKKQQQRLTLASSHLPLFRSPFSVRLLNFFYRLNLFNVLIPFTKIFDLPSSVPPDLFRENIEGRTLHVSRDGTSSLSSFLVPDPRIPQTS